jgi:hypothetical protein
LLPSLHEASGRQTFEVGHCECIVQPWHVLSLPHTGVVLTHALASAAVHCTHVIVGTLQTPVGDVHWVSDEHPCGESIAASSEQRLSGFLPGQ